MKIAAGEYRWAPGFKGYTDTMGLPVRIIRANEVASGNHSIPKGAQTCNVELASGRKVFTTSENLGRRAPASAVKAWKVQRVKARVAGAVNSMKQTMEEWGDVLTAEDRTAFAAELAEALGVVPWIDLDDKRAREFQALLIPRAEPRKPGPA